MEILSRTVSLEEIAAVLDVTKARISQLMRDKIIPRSDKGRYKLVACSSGYIKYLRDVRKGGGQSLTETRTRLTEAQAQAEELRVKAMQGELISAEVASEKWERVIMACRSRLLSLPTKLAPQVPKCRTTVEIKTLIENGIYEALDELSRISADIDREKSEGVRPAAKAFRKRMGRPRKNPLS